MSRSTAVSYLRCEYLKNPLGIDERQPRLSWILFSNRRGVRQTAWRVRTASSAAILAAGGADLWDSGRIEDDRSAQIVYHGVPLTSRQECWWQVQVWDEQGETALSEPAFWTMGLLEKEDWQAQWIAADPDYRRHAPHAVTPTLTEPGTPPWFRKVFSADGAVQKATLYVSARGVAEVYLNGRRVGEDVFVPEWTDYTKRIHYRTYDVTEMIRTGRNVVGAVLGDGWYSGYVGWQETRGRYGLETSLLIQLELMGADGSRRTVRTDSSWKCAAGPIVCSDFMMGETYDARFELTGWEQPDYDDRGWSPVRLVEPPAVPLVAQPSEPVRIAGMLRPVSVHESRPGTWIFNLGQNIAGWVRLKVRGPAGTRITLRHGERLNPDGTLYTENLRRAKATDVYILSGRGEEIWQPRFTFHGFQYVELSGLSGRPAEDAITGCVVHSNLEQTGRFDCSHPLVSRLWQNALWSQKGNFISVPTDCPQRDERLGWTGDAQIFSHTASYNMDTAAFFTKWMRDIADAQTPEGIFPDTAPRLREDVNYVGLDGLGGAAGWADAGIIIPWVLWRFYGDTRIIERYYDAMSAWLEYLERTNPDCIRRNELGNNYGDWLCIPSDTTFRTHSPMKTLLATAYWADDAAKLARMARAIKREQEARRWQAMFERIRRAFQKEFLLPDGRLTVPTQTAYLLALAFNLLPQEVRQTAFGHLMEELRSRSWHLSTGFIGVRFLNPVLTEMGRADAAWKLLLNEDYPSWLYPVLHGATTIWERWNGWTKEDGFFNPQMNSFNHYSLGSVGEWLYRFAAGIELDPEENGFKRFVLKPYPSSRLDWAGAEYRCLYGWIRSRWQREGGLFRYDITIPANTAARVFIPSEPGTPIHESGVPIEQVPGITALGREGGWAVYEIPSGTYRFVSHYSCAETISG
ncbi:MAG TPA: glycoside hydrolase family 78 protein [Anaerohalosphaeraceae bacterium]|nr:glycoside hydrolase family 78 protein [Anaerohalosphaeraceae bacterium]